MVRKTWNKKFVSVRVVRGKTFPLPHKKKPAHQDRLYLNFLIRD